jgi:hypothetical protein
MGFDSTLARDSFLAFEADHPGDTPGPLPLTICPPMSADLVHTSRTASILDQCSPRSPRRALARGHGVRERSTGAMPPFARPLRFSLKRGSERQQHLLVSLRVGAAALS